MDDDIIQNVHSGPVYREPPGLLLKMLPLENLYRKAIDQNRPLIYEPLYRLLQLAACFYRLVLFLRLKAYECGWLKSRKLPVPVISVGNLSLGGTGKTPMVIWIARTLKENGRCPAILSRGYGGHSPAKVNVVGDGQGLLLPAEAVGDEPAMMARKLKGVFVLTGRDRCQTGQYAVEQMGADILILDDGFQHLRLKRDLNILLLDHNQPLADERLFPAGGLREPVSGLKRADWVCFTRCPENARDTQPVEVPYGAGVSLTGHRPCGLIHWPDGRTADKKLIDHEPVAAFSGIARPESFRKTLENAGAQVVAFKAFADHHSYCPEDIEQIDKMAQEAGARFIITSEKDAVKLQDPGLSLPLYALSIELEFLSGGEAFKQRIFRAAEAEPGHLKTRKV